jgi:hypothetical protein
VVPLEISKSGREQLIEAGLWIHTDMC